MDATKGAIGILVGIVLLLNLQILYLFPKQQDEYSDGYTPCERHVFINFNYQPRGKTNESSANSGLLLMKWNSSSAQQGKAIALKRYSKNYLTIGIPTAKWTRGPEALISTLQSLVSETTLQQKLEIVVVILLLDSNQEYNYHLLETVLKKFQYYVDIGFIYIIQPGRTDVEGTKTVDINNQAFQIMAEYARKLSHYYMHLADDIECAPGFYHQMRHFMGTSGLLRHPGSWSILEFSELALVGKMLRTSDMHKFATFMTMFTKESEPVERTLAQFRHIMLQEKQVLLKPTLFQRADAYSEANGGQVQKDRFFDDGKGRIHGDDPDGKVFTNIDPVGQNFAEFAYRGRPNFFWAKAPKQGDWLTIVFDEDIDLEKVVIITGMDGDNTEDEGTDKDKDMYVLKDATVQASPKLLRIDETSKRPYCANYKQVGKIQKALTELTDISNKVYNRQTKCLTITVGTNHSDSVMFQGISVFLVS